MRKETVMRRNTAISGDNSASKKPKEILAVKVGGSLMDDVSSVIATLKAASESPDCAFEKIIVIPGGGIFADEIRGMNTDDDTAHWMAILAMEKFGYLISALGVYAVDGLTDCLPEISHGDCNCNNDGVSACNSNSANRGGKLILLLPYRFMREYDPLPHSWDITSDSIAAWAASKLSEMPGDDVRVSLLLLKSVDGIRRKSGSIDIKKDMGKDVEIISDHAYAAPVLSGAQVSSGRITGENYPKMPGNNPKNNPEIMPEICSICEGMTFDEVDPCCIPLILESGIDGYVLNARKPDLLTDFILGRGFSGTHIHRYP